MGKKFLLVVLAIITIIVISTSVAAVIEVQQIKAEAARKPGIGWIGQFQYCVSQEGFQYFFSFEKNAIIVIALEDPSINTVFTGKWLDKWTFSADIGEGNFLIRVSPVGVYYFEFNTITKKFQRYEPEFNNLQLDSCTIDNSVVHFYR